METDTNGAKEIKSKAQRLVEYLTEITRLRSKLIRHVEEYDRVLWLHEIPKEPEYCFTQAWGPDESFGNDCGSRIGDGAVVKIIGPGGFSSRKIIERTMNRGGV